MKAPSQLNLSCNCQETQVRLKKKKGISTFHQHRIALSGERHLSARMTAALISSTANEHALWSSSQAHVGHVTKRTAD